MSASSGSSRGERGLVALAELASTSVVPPSPAVLSRGIKELSANMTAPRARSRMLLRWSLIGVGATAATSATMILAFLLVARGGGAPADLRKPLGYRIEGGSIVEGGYLRGVGTGKIKVSFTEGTEFSLMPGSRARLGAVDAAGARLAIEEGTAAFRVTPRIGARWTIDVGPFLVTVKGTAFTVSWDAIRERFELDLRSGRVTIRGPASGGDIALRAGQRLVVNLPKGESLITEEKPTTENEPPATAGGGAAAEPTGLPGRTGPSSRPSNNPRTGSSERRSARNAIAAPGLDPSVDGVGEGASDKRWAEVLAEGKLDRILEEAERAGIKTTLDNASSEDLFALATAARYRRHMDLAHAALLAERRRFPGSNRALDAAFLLGRLEESDARGSGRAIEWYDQYLTQAPRGRYAAEALGRKMIVTSEREGPLPAQRLAEEYLHRFPNGSYAGSARALRRVP